MNIKICFIFIEISLQYEANTAKGLEVKGATGIAGAAAMRPISTPVTTTVYNTQSSKYYKGRPIQSQPRTIRDGNLNNSYNNRYILNSKNIIKHQILINDYLE